MTSPLAGRVLRCMHRYAALCVALLAIGCLPPVEHEVDVGGQTLTYRQVSKQRVGRTEFEYAFSATLTASAGTPGFQRTVQVSSLAAATAVLEGTLVFPGGSDAAAAPFVIRQDRTQPFDPGALQFALVAPSLPALSSSAPASGASDVPTSAWLVLDFVQAIAGGAEAGFALDCGAPVPVTATLVTAFRLAINPDPALPPSADCSLAWTGPAGPASLDFATASVGAPATVVYDRRDTGLLPPFPDDVWLDEDATTATGYRVAVPEPDRDPSFLMLANALLEGTRELDGFSPVAGFVVMLSDAPDPDSLPTRVDTSLDPLASIGLYDIDPASPEFGQRIPFEMTIRADVLPTAPLTHQLVMVPSRPLRPEGRYGFVVTRRALADGGRPYGPSDYMAAALAAAQPGEDPAVTRARDRAGDVLAFLANDAVPPIPPEDVALALRVTVRSTDTIPDTLRRMKEQVQALPPPDFTITSVQASGGDVAAIVQGTWQAPDWRVLARIPLDANGDPTIQRTRAVPFTLAIPNAALDGPVPITMYQHGSPGSAAGEVPNEASDYLAPAGFAVIGFTDPLNNELGDVQAQFISIFGALLVDRDVPDFWLQTYGEQMAFLRLIESLGDLDVVPVGAPDGEPDLDPTLPLTYVGISFGGVHGSATMPFAPEIRAAALVAGGGNFTERLLLQDTTDPLGQGSFLFGQLPAFFPTARPSDVWVGLMFFQMVYDAQDPNVYATFTYDDPLPVSGTLRKPSLLIMEGLNDSFSPTNATRAEAFAHGNVPLLTPVEQAVPYLPVAQDRVSGNIDAETTAALVQYVPVGVPGIPPTEDCLGTEGHFCVQSARRSELQRAAFFLSAVNDPVPTILDGTLDSDGDGRADVLEIFEGTDPDVAD